MQMISSKNMGYQQPKVQGKEMRVLATSVDKVINFKELSDSIQSRN